MAYLAAMADVAGMMHACARPSAARAASRAGNLCCWGRFLIRLVTPVTSVHSSRLLCITGIPPILSAKTPSGICEAQQPCGVHQARYHTSDKHSIPVPACHAERRELAVD